MIPHKKKSVFFLLASLLILQCFMVSGKASTCEAAASPYSKIATPKTNTYVYIRKSYNMNSTKLAKFSKGCGATILKTGKIWMKVKSGSVTGYVKKSWIVSGKKLETYAAKNKFPKKLKVNVNSLIVRAKATRQSDILTDVSKGETYKIIKETAQWAKINADGHTGYVMKKYTTCSYDLKNATKVPAASKSSTPADKSDSSSSSSSAYNKVALCKVESLRVRQSDSTQAQIVGYMNDKTSGNILVKGKNWTKIQSGSVIGYIMNDYYVSGSLVPTYAKKAGIDLKATLKANMNVRAAASTSSKRIGGASKGSSYIVKKEYKDWVSIAYGSKTGYLKKDYITVEYDFAKAISSSANNTTPSAKSDSTTGAKIASYALQFKGNPYVYGGTSLTNGCDCSGFTQAIYKHFGYSIPRISRDQANAGHEVTASSSSLQRGDLIFYANTSGVINHVSLYIGDSKVIHASNEKVGIIVSTYNYRTPVKAVRILN